MVGESDSAASGGAPSADDCNQEKLDEMVKFLKEWKPSPSKSSQGKDGSHGQYALRVKKGTDKNVCDTQLKLPEDFVNTILGIVGTLASTVQALTTKISDVSADLGRVVKKIDSLADICGRQQKEINELKESHNDLVDENNKLVSMIDDLDQRERKDFVIVSGSPVAHTNDTTDSAIKDITLTAIRSEMNVNLVPEDLLECRKFGRRGNQVLVKLKDKSNFFGQMRVASNSNSVSENPKRRALFVNDFLTRVRSNILYKMRQMCKNSDGRISSAYSRSGILFLRFPDRTRPVRVASMEEVRRIAGDMELVLPHS